MQKVLKSNVLVQLLKAKVDKCFNFFKFQKIDLSKLNREECNELLINRGFYKKENKNAEVPEEVLKTLRYKRADEL